MVVSAYGFNSYKRTRIVTAASSFRNDRSHNIDHDRMAKGRLNMANIQLYIDSNKDVGVVAELVNIGECTWCM